MSKFVKRALGLGLTGAALVASYGLGRYNEYEGGNPKQRLEAEARKIATDCGKTAIQEVLKGVQNITSQLSADQVTTLNGLQVAVAQKQKECFAQNARAAVNGVEAQMQPPQVGVTVNVTAK